MALNQKIMGANVKKLIWQARDKIYNLDKVWISVLVTLMYNTCTYIALLPYQNKTF
jgi:hypothetical protein